MDIPGHMEAQTGLLAGVLSRLQDSGSHLEMSFFQREGNMLNGFEMCAGDLPKGMFSFEGLGSARVFSMGVFELQTPERSGGLDLLSRNVARYQAWQHRVQNGSWMRIAPAGAGGLVFHVSCGAERQQWGWQAINSAPLKMSTSI